jgi:hypothetical protein
MAEKSWQVVKNRYCSRADCEVFLEAEETYPAEWMPDQPPQVLRHRCSKGMECSLKDGNACTWSGSNPGYDPFKD